MSRWSAQDELAIASPEAKYDILSSTLKGNCLDNRSDAGERFVVFNYPLLKSVPSHEALEVVELRHCPQPEFEGLRYVDIAGSQRNR
jgi:hypothetical protein